MFLRKAGATSFDDPRAIKYSERLKKLRSIKDYMYRVHILERSKSYEEVTEIFVRVNSLGAKLRSSDLALAQITAAWPNSLEIFQEYQEKCKTIGFDFDLAIYLKMMIALATGQSRFRTVSSLSRDELENSWVAAKESMNFALNFIRSNLHIDSPALLSSPFLIITIAYFAHYKAYKLSPDDEKLLKQWILSANLKGRYQNNQTRLAPFYDLLSTLYYPNLSKKMAMKIGKESDSSKVTTENFDRMAEDCNLSKPLVKQHVVIVAEKVLDKLSEVNFGSAPEEKLCSLIENRCKLFLANFK